MTPVSPMGGEGKPDQLSRKIWFPMTYKYIQKLKKVLKFEGR